MLRVNADPGPKVLQLCILWPSGLNLAQRNLIVDHLDRNRIDKDRMLQARNGMVFIQAWIDLQLKRERRRDIKRWLESKKGRVERQLEMLERRVQQ